MDIRKLHHALHNKLLELIHFHKMHVAVTNLE